MVTRFHLSAEYRGWFIGAELCMKVKYVCMLVIYFLMNKESKVWKEQSKRSFILNKSGMSASRSYGIEGWLSKGFTRRTTGEAAERSLSYLAFLFLLWLVRQLLSIVASLFGSLHKGSSFDFRLQLPSLPPSHVWLKKTELGKKAGGTRFPNLLRPGIIKLVSVQAHALKAGPVNDEIGSACPENRNDEQRRNATSPGTEVTWHVVIAVSLVTRGDSYSLLLSFLSIGHWRQVELSQKQLRRRR